MASERVVEQFAADMLIASVAAAKGLQLLTRNADDFSGLDDVVTVIDV